MKVNPKTMIKNIIFILISVIISYGIASVLILGDIKRPYDIGNTDFFVDTYDVEDIVNETENMYVDVDNKRFTINPSSLSKIKINYDESSNTTGYVVMNFDVMSELSLNVRICIFNDSNEPMTVSGRVKEGINIIKVPLNDANMIRIDFPSQTTTQFVLNEIKVTNQIVGVLPISWYIVFVLSMLVSLELFGIGISKIAILRTIYKNSLGKVVKLFKSDVFNLGQFIKLYKLEFIMSGLVCIFTYGYHLANFSLGVDDERDFVHSVGSLENVKELLFKEGRVGGYLFRKIETIDGTFTPFVEDIISIVCMMLVVIVMIKALNLATNGKLKSSAMVVFAGMLVSFPLVNAEMMSYSIANGNIYFSMFLTTLAIMLVTLYCKNRTNHRLVSAIAVLIFALYSAEANNVWFIVGTVLVSLAWVISNKDINLKKWIQNIFIYAGTYIVSFVLYIILKTFLKDNGYIGGYIQWEKGKYGEGIKRIFEWMRDMFTNENLPGAIYLLISILIFVVFIFSYIAKEKKERAILILFLSGCLLITPFIMCFIAGGKLPYRTLIGLILLESGIWFIMLNYINKNTIQRFVFMLIAIAIIWKQSVWMNRIFYGANLCDKLDMQMGYAIGEEIERIAGDVIIDKPVVFVGRVQHTSPSIYKIDAVGQSIFLRQSSKYKVFYLRYLGFNVQQAGADLIAEAETLAVDMNAWPLDNSVKEFDNVIVVKLN